MQRLLLAGDVLMAEGADLQSVDEATAAYFAALQRAEADRLAIQHTLESAGIHVIKVPGISAGRRGLSWMNVVHDADRVLVPVYGGLFKSLDDQAIRIWSDALGPEIEVIPILCGETQRREGGLHCAVAVYTGLPSGTSLLPPLPAAPDGTN